jgi:hypothetical protein
VSSKGEIAELVSPKAGLSDKGCLRPVFSSTSDVSMATNKDFPFAPLNDTTLTIAFYK